MGILLSGALRSNALGKFLCQGLNLLWQGRKTDLDALIQSQEPGGPVSEYIPGTASYPAWYYNIFANQCIVVLVSGVETTNQGIALYQGFTPPITGFNPPRNSWADGFASSIITYLQAKSRFELTGRFIAAGHSGGGMVASLLADRRTADGRVNATCFHTFGAPRVTFESLATVADRTPGVRWMLHNDPIPLLPLRVSEAPWIIPIVGFPAALAAGSFAHWAGGWQLIPGQIGHPEELPTSATVAPVTNLGAWLFSQEGAGGNGHAIADYEAAMISEYLLLTAPNSNPTRVEATEPTENLTRRYVAQAQRESAVSIANAEERQNAQPVVIPQGQVWAAERFGRIWVVTFGGTAVVMTSSKKGARGLARLMNDAFRRLQRSAVVDPNAVSTQMQAYLEAAANPLGGFQPVMNTTW